MLEDILVPIFICVLLPVAIVWIVGRTRQNETNRKTEVLLKAIESGAQIDPDMFKDKEKTPRSVKQQLLDKLTTGCITSFMGAAFLAMYVLKVEFFLADLLPIAGFILLAVGLAMFISYFVGKNMLAKEIEAEENTLK